jgi:hypothetical protein
MRIGRRPPTKPKSLEHVPDTLYSAALELQAQNRNEHGPDLSLTRCIQIVQRQQQERK